MTGRTVAYVRTGLALVRLAADPHLPHWAGLALALVALRVVRCDRPTVLAGPVSTAPIHGWRGMN